LKLIFKTLKGVYETSMKTKAYDSVEDWAEIKSREANTQKGTSAFSEDSSKFDSTAAFKSSLDVGFAFEAPVAAISANVKAEFKIVAKIEILGKNPKFTENINFERKLKFWSKIFGNTRNFWATITILGENKKNW